MRALCASIITSGALIGLGLAALGVGVRYQQIALRQGDLNVYVRWGQLDTPLMLIIIVLLASLLVGFASAFVGLAYHHERRHFERQHHLAGGSKLHSHIES